jgi:short-subunit dehydrogenase involved in D-alanine esterification of teichoic acids
MTKYFLELGAKVAITSRDIEKKYCCRTRIRNCLPLQCDVRHYEEVENMLQGVLKAWSCRCTFK